MQKYVLVTLERCFNELANERERERKGKKPQKAKRKRDIKRKEGNL